jgi:hypothetical protein
MKKSAVVSAMKKSRTRDGRSTDRSHHHSLLCCWLRSFRMLERRQEHIHHGLHHFSNPAVGSRSTKYTHRLEFNKNTSIFRSHNNPSCHSQQPRTVHPSAPPSISLVSFQTMLTLIHDKNSKCIFGSSVPFIGRFAR